MSTVVSQIITGTAIMKTRQKERNAHSYRFKGFFVMKIWLDFPYPLHSMLV